MTRVALAGKWAGRGASGLTGVAASACSRASSQVAATAPKPPPACRRNALRVETGSLGQEGPQHRAMGQPPRWRQMKSEGSNIVKLPDQLGPGQVCPTDSFSEGAILLPSEPCPPGSRPNEGRLIEMRSIPTSASGQGRLEARGRGQEEGLQELNQRLAHHLEPNRWAGPSGAEDARRLEPDRETRAAPRIL